MGVTVPGTEGTFTVTNNHSLIVSQVKAGVITVREPRRQGLLYLRRLPLL
eukprot:NODE_5769_length_556_cov_339.680639.p4 GENE.NODE_5769_length_556_cov_339.680639~~NODE_5769_length_556_cov_339.680639.p4  ORF type:complete len:50 (+),score=6.50 NODE_5769_length_556_cov_339.680639:3-152(+)